MNPIEQLKKELRIAELLSKIKNESIPQKEWVKIREYLDTNKLR